VFSVHKAQLIHCNPAADCALPLSLVGMMAAPRIEAAVPGHGRQKGRDAAENLMVSLSNHEVRALRNRPCPESKRPGSLPAFVISAAF